MRRFVFKPFDAAQNAKELKKSQYFQPVPDFEMTITPLNSKFYAEFDEVSGISRHFHEAQTLNFLRVILHGFCQLLWTCPILNFSAPGG